MPLNDVLRHRTHAFANSLNSHRILIYSFVSLLAVSAAIANALRNYSNFYSVAISLAKSNRSVLALANFGFLFSLLCGHIVQRIFFGTLRANEVERLYDRLWFFITESLLAFTIFRDEFDIPFALMFGFLLFVKSFHWLAGDRIEWMDQRPYPGPSPLFHIRMMALFIILWTTDFIMFLIAVENTLAHGVGGMVLFASEYGILMASVLNTISRYLLSTYELRRAGRRGGENAPPWENKSMWVFYIELATDFLKLTTYLVFFIIIITFYGLPLNIVRDVYITARSFVTRLRALHRYQTATRNMDQSRRTVLDQPQGTEPAAAAAPAPEPGAAPGEAQRPHAAAPAGGQGPNNFRGNIPLGNPLGLMGRLFGPPAQAPIPGEVPPAQIQNNAPPPGNLAGPLPPGVVIQYHIQYHQQHNQQAVPAPRLQPPPQFAGFAGFAGPGGVWQPWPQDGIATQEPAPEVTNASPTPVPPTPPPTVDPRPSSPSTTSPLPNLDSASPPTPREAAALAALRRFNSNNNGSSSSSVTASQSPESLSTGQELSTEASPAQLTSTLSSSPAPSQPSLAGTAAVADQSARAANSAPSLIPLYDYAASSLRPTQSSLTAGTAFLDQARVRGIDETSRFTPRSAHASQRNPQPAQPNPASLLPPTLTDEQLAHMDQLTREAIDERLRVLEGVSGAVYRCIDDLMRMRSALPSLPIVPTQIVAPSVPSAPANPERLRNDDVTGPSSQSQSDILTAGPSTAGPSGSTNGDVSDCALTGNPETGKPEVPESPINISVNHGAGSGDV
ncbi:hypothetical protein DXG03_003874 [Asterophora parasitica]|uniref:E3 ubiquitin-protein ligase synoviolin-like TPR repeats domain-containing protein n=1 Tax=Asterophora parasitica TaxID=117018 RepID=A0A9P7GCP5_9AGAR|nr:hypothetical protein DXG03_003874 [Asterophora parasitica]